MGLEMEKTFDFDQIIIGTGFGGSCSALRLSEKGYKVLMLEKGKRWKTEDFPKTNMNPWKSFWFPWLGMGGLFQARLTNKFSAVYGAGVGGGFERPLHPEGPAPNRNAPQQALVNGAQATHHTRVVIDRRSPPIAGRRSRRQ